MMGELVRLRARHEADLPILDGLHADMVNAIRSGHTPWRPISPGTNQSMYRITAPNDRETAFSAVALESGALAGEVSLWQIDTHHRSAHIGMAVLPAFRGKGISTDMVRIMCRYAFTVLGLHRLQVDTLADNHAMLAAAERVGFRREAVHRDANWVMGRYIDRVALGLLAAEWTEQHPA